MGLLDLFRMRTRPPKANPWQEGYRRLAAALANVSDQVLSLDAEIGTIHLALHTHESAITECRNLTDQHGKTLMRLEQIVSSQPAEPISHTNRSIGIPQTTPVLAAAEPTASPLARRLDVDQFSDQQKRLLSVFFQNRDREMSYADVAAALGKSAHTVKNQINQIRHKADLFDCVTGPESRNFFKLKDDLKVETRLKVGRPAGRPLSTIEPDRSSPAPVTVPKELIY
jgi:DNA-binding CsgD family transcriptional regulator